MLEFCSEPYQFFPPTPWAPLLKVGPVINRFLLRYDLKVRDMDIGGEFEEVKELVKSGARILFAPNHPTRTDPQFVGEIQNRLGVNSSFMAAYDVFLENRIRCWFMQKTGCFSIDREGNDRKALSTAIDILKKGDLSLTIFPEGNVYHLNDRVTPVLDGPSFIAAKAQQGLKGDGQVWIVPISVKYSHQDDIRPQVWNCLSHVADHSSYRTALQREDPVESVRSLGAHLISKYVIEKTDLDYRADFSNATASEIQDEIYQLAKNLIAGLEKELDLETTEEVFILDRIRKIRSRVHQLRTGEDRPPGMDAAKHARLAAQSIFAFRLLAYVLPYLSEKPTIDRYAETVARIREDYFSKNFKPIGRRKAFASIGKPISIDNVLAESNGKTKVAIPILSRKIEETIQSGIDSLNEKNSEIGGKLISQG